MPSNTPPIYCPSFLILPFTCPSFVPIPFNSSLFVPHSSLKSSPLPIHPPNSSHQIPHILYIIRCKRTKPLRRKGKFSAEKATKRVFFPFQALVCRRPHICPSTFSKMSLHFVPPPVPPVAKIDNISSILPLIRKPLESHSKTVRISSENNPKSQHEPPQNITMRHL